jgi:hypothetical protein
MLVLSRTICASVGSKKNTKEMQMDIGQIWIQLTSLRRAFVRNVEVLLVFSGSWIHIHLHFPISIIYNSIALNPELLI